MDQNNNNNFMDSRTIWAVLLVGLVFFGWNQYVSVRYGSVKAPPSTEAAPQGNPNAGKQLVNPAGELQKEKPVNSVAVAPVDEKVFSFGNELVNLQISSRGMSLKAVNLLKFKGRGGEPIVFEGGEEGLFGTFIGGQPLSFRISQESANVFIGEAEGNGVAVIKRMVFGANYKVDIQTEFKSTQASLALPEVVLGEKLKSVPSGSVFSPPAESQDLLIVHSDGEKEIVPSAEKDGVALALEKSTMVSINGHYFTAAYLDKSEVMPNFSMNHRAGAASLKGILSYPIGSGRNAFTMTAVGYVGPKETEALEAVDPLLLRVVKFGFFSGIAKPLLAIMKWFYSIVGNWGWSIILLTLLVRLLVMPFNVMSFRSMKAMQKVQPLIQSLRERYQNDPATLNREMMELMKKHKVNPMGGCLPMLLQIPIFFALYRVFSESIELYQAPFILWIHDLSTKDAYFVLPVLMAIVMYLQQKMTPSTMDPAQAKVMQFMPLVFSLMMISLPSALTLYMFVSTFFGILQQYLFLREKKSAVAVR